MTLPISVTSLIELAGDPANSVELECKEPVLIINSGLCKEGKLLGSVPEQNEVKAVKIQGGHKKSIWNFEKNFYCKFRNVDFILWKQ